MRVYLQQLARLESLGASVALPAHGDPIDEPAALFRKYIVHRGMREDRIVLAMKGERSAAEILPDAYDDTPPHVWPIAALSLQAHLDKLVAEGRAVRNENVYRLVT
jgi:glyoxylase-like metal-dependent hydrolase (beta-lactamase superfamily II)